MARIFNYFPKWMYINVDILMNYKLYFQAGSEAVRQYREMDSELMEVSISTIKVLATPLLFPSGRLKLKCTASIYSLYWQTTEKSAEMERGRGHPNEIFDDNLNNRDHEYLPSSGEEYAEQGPYHR